MAQYPDEIYTPRTLVNKPGTAYDEAKTSRLFAEDQNGTNDEIIAIQEELGLNPKGSYDSVAALLTDVLSKISSYLDQSVKTTAAPIFTGVSFSENAVIKSNKGWLKLEAITGSVYINYDNPSTNVQIGRGGYTTQLFVRGNITAKYKSSDGSAGISTTFKDANGKTFTVKDGIITAETAP